MDIIQLYNSLAWFAPHHVLHVRQAQVPPVPLVIKDYIIPSN